MAFNGAISRMDEACLRVFGRDVTYLSQAGGQATVLAVFQPTQEAEDASPGVYAVLFARLRDLPATPVRGDEVEIEGVCYKVFDIEADSEGAAVLRLRKTG